MNEPSENRPTRRPSDPGAEGVTPDQLIEEANDPESEKRTTGEAQAAENAELDPPA